jgi:glycine/D-amino acid oxidase-like deaminating enzyme
MVTGAGTASTYASLSLWHGSSGDDLTPRVPLPGDLSADVAIIGGGLTGLWTAYYLLKRQPDLRVIVVEKDIAGFGASGRNGGWCSSLFPASVSALEARHGREAALRMRAAMIDTVSEVGRVTEHEGIACDFVLGGTITFARSAAQLAAAQVDVAEAARYGVDDVRLLSTGTDTPALPRATHALDATFDPACARLHPAKLVRGLARVVETLGATIYEGTEVVSWAPHTVTTTRGTVSADAVVIATEGYTATFPQARRRTLPLYSLMIATEPLPESVWADIGLAHGHTFSDYRHLLIYGQRTADNRFAFGGRGARYHWGSSVHPEWDSNTTVFDHLRTALTDLFPQVGAAAITHRWGGPLGVARDWHAHVTHDPTTGIASAGGYVGDGLSTTNLAGRTLADLLTGTPSALTALPWVGHHSPSWEPEPLRFFGANAGLLGMALADAEEKVTRRPSVTARLLAPLTGH